MKTSGRVNITTEDKGEIAEYGIGDEIKVSAIGTITELREYDRIDMPVMVGEKSKKVKEYTIEIKLKDISTDNISSEDKKEAESENIPIKKWKEIKALRNSVKAKHGMV